MYGLADMFEIVRIDSTLDSEGRVMTSTTTPGARHDYPFEEVKKIGGGAFGSIW